MTRHTPTDSELASVLVDAMRLCDRMKADGATKAERDAYLEHVLRTVWPFRREWRYLCEDCRDTGLVAQRCTAAHRCDGISSRTDLPGQKPGKYQRLCTLHPEYEHDYSVPCFCAKGASWRQAISGRVDETVEAAGAARPTPRKFSKLGR